MTRLARRLLIAGATIALSTVATMCAGGWLILQDPSFTDWDDIGDRT